MNQIFVLRDLIKRIKRNFEIQISSELEIYGLTLTQLFVLKQLREGKKTIGQMSKTMDVSYSTISAMVDRLESADWVVRHIDPADRRVVWIEKTEKFDEASQHLQDCLRKNVGELEVGISMPEWEFMLTTLEKLSLHLEKKVEEKS